eukprot:6145959-Pyramimonas_sp.AAC.1
MKGSKQNSKPLLISRFTTGEFNSPPEYLRAPKKRPSRESFTKPLLSRSLQAGMKGQSNQPKSSKMHSPAPLDPL